METFCICGVSLPWSGETRYCCEPCERTAAYMAKKKREEQLYWTRKQFRRNPKAVAALEYTDRDRRLT